MPVKLLILFILLQVTNKCQQHPAGNTSPETASGVNPGRILVEKCTDQISMHPLDTVIFQFYEIPGRGYAWSLASFDSLSAVLLPTGTNRTILTDRDGAPEKVEFCFRAEKKGEISLKFIYTRPWEKTKPAADSCITKILIQ